VKRLAAIAAALAGLGFSGCGSGAESAADCSRHGGIASERVVPAGGDTVYFTCRDGVVFWASS
jgi:hypothetical protein